MTTFTDLQALGYDARPAMFAGEGRPTVWFVSRPGLETYVAEDDAATLDALADPALLAGLDALGVPDDETHGAAGQ